MVEKLYRKHGNILNFTENWDADVLATGDVQKNAIDEEQESF